MLETGNVLGHSGDFWKSKKMLRLENPDRHIWTMIAMKNKKEQIEA